MWLILRLLTLVGVYIWKFFWRTQSVDDVEVYRGVPCVHKLVTNKNRFVKEFHGMEYSGPLRFQFSPEKGWDAFFKGLGLAVEQQSGDSQFDRQVYITCDQLALGEMLQQDPPLRRALLALFANGARRIFSDGANIWAEFRDEDHDVAAAREALFMLRTSLLSVDSTNQRSRLDAFFWKAVAVESLAWSIACYGVPGFIQFFWERNTLYLDAWPVFNAGFVWSIAVFTTLLGLIAVLLRGSSRGHRIIIESFLLLIIGVPLSTVQAVSDINIEMDTSRPILLESKVTAKTIEVRRGRRGRSYTHYFLHLQPVVAGPRAVAGRLEVESALYSGAQEGRSVTITLRDGRLGFPWLQSISPK